MKKYDEEYDGEMVTRFSNIFERQKKTLETVSSIAHHALDWYFQESAWMAYKKTPEKLAVHALSFVKKFNDEYGEYGESYLESKNLAKFGGYSNQSSLNYSSFYYEVKSNSIDPNLFLIDPSKKNNALKDKM